MADKNPERIIERLTKKVFNLPQEYIDVVKNDPRFVGYQMTEVPIDKLIEDNDLNNPVALSNHAQWWSPTGNEEDIDPSKFKYDESKYNKQEVINGTLNKLNGKITLNDGRHRTRALKNDGYTHIVIPITRG